MIVMNRKAFSSKKTGRLMKSDTDETEYFYIFFRYNFIEGDNYGKIKSK